MKADLISEGEFAGATQAEGPAVTAAATPMDACGSQPASAWSASIRNGAGKPRPSADRDHSLDGRGRTARRRSAAVVDPGPQTLAIQYHGINLTAPDNVIYRYQLQGLDDGWQEAGAADGSHLLAPAAGNLYL